MVGAAPNVNLGPIDFVSEPLCKTLSKFMVVNFHSWQVASKSTSLKIQITCSRLSDSGGLFTISDFSILEPATGYNPHSHSAIQTALASRKPGSHVIQYVSKRKTY